ncbi:hypothetical protein niasHT_008800 [Heterodera trifolii]|uniref:Uncharacterized protein n=1 Tax=Heterodera trifolii TaxID=157864 RepID=A0ABD2LSM1_9BILA
MDVTLPVNNSAGEWIGEERRDRVVLYAPREQGQQEEARLKKDDFAEWQRWKEQQAKESAAKHSRALELVRQNQWEYDEHHFRNLLLQWEMPFHGGGGGLW